MSFARRCLPFLAVGVASAWMAFANTNTGDYPADAGLAVHALIYGHLPEFFATHATGPFAVLVQAPFAALGSGSPLTEYQWACVPCLLAAGFLGLYLAAVGRRRGLAPLSRFAIAALCLVNPLTFEALQNGHPEEILAATLAVAAVVVASKGHGRRAAIFLGFAIASKQWAVIAILPVLMALPAQRVRTALVAAAIVLAFTLPGLVAAPDSFSSGQSKLASSGGIVAPWNVWYPFATVTTETFSVGSNQLTAQVHRVPAPGRASHPLIVLLGLGIPLALALRRRRFGLSGADAMALLTLLALLRCALDPVGNLYYHEPLLLALIAWDALDCRGLPLRGLVGAAVAALFWRWSHNLSDPQMLNAAYIAVVATVAVAIATRLFHKRCGDAHEPGWGSGAAAEPLSLSRAG